MQIEMDVTSSQSSLSFGTYNYQYTRGIDVQQVIVRECYKFKTCSDLTDSIYETGFCIPNKLFTMDCCIIKSAYFLLRYTNWNTDNTHSVSWELFSVAFYPLNSIVLFYMVKCHSNKYTKTVQLYKIIYTPFQLHL